MLARLLKYDLRAIFKYWWIAAVSSIAFSVIAGVCINIINVDNTEYYFIVGLAILGLVLSIIGIGIFAVVNEVLILVRLYKHFFTDQGYLTFTLPVKKNQLLNSKLLMAYIFNFFTSLLIFFEIFFALAIAFPEEVFNPAIYESIFDGLGWIIDEIGAGFLAVYLIEILLLALFSSLFSTLTVFVCLTVASVITRKHKVITAIALYYAANSVISGITQFVSFNGSFVTVFDKMDTYSLNVQNLCVALILLIAIGFMAMICAGLYILENRLLDKKLNLD